MSGYFAWVRSKQPWAPTSITPVKIWDREMADYIKLDIVAIFPMTREQEMLTIKELEKIYPLEVNNGPP
jgi:hypothetical protein